MKNSQIVLVAFLVGMVTSMFVGCIIPNPNQTPIVTQNPQTGQLTTNRPDAYVVDTATISNLVAQLQLANQTLAPVNPYAPVIKLGASALGALVTGVSLLFARSKNNQAVAHAATADQLAASVVAQGPQVTQAVLDHASNNTAVYPAVANVINQNTV